MTWVVADYTFVRPIDDIGVELRYVWNGELRVSQMFKLWQDPKNAATEKRQELKRLERSG